jgi:hypothetical protein
MHVDHPRNLETDAAPGAEIKRVEPTPEAFRPVNPLNFFCEGSRLRSRPGTLDDLVPNGFVALLKDTDFDVMRWWAVLAGMDLSACLSRTDFVSGQNLFDLPIETKSGARRPLGGVGGVGKRAYLVAASQEVRLYADLCRFPIAERNSLRYQLSVR